MGTTIKILKPGQYLEHIFNPPQLPSGIVIKGAPGVGATTLELDREKSKRNVILVSPLLAILKSKARPGILTFHGNIENKLETVIQYYTEYSDKYLKIHTTAESLRSLEECLNHVGVSLDESWHFVLDEHDLMILQSDFRDRLPVAFDYYKSFPKTHRTCVSATHYAFSDPQLKNEDVTIIELEIPEIRTINLFMTDNTITGALLAISRCSGTICIFVDSLNWINTIIPQLGTTDIAIFCGANNQEKAGTYYSEYTQQPTAKINFFTSAYFVGCDLQIKPHLITISDPASAQLRGLTKAQYVQIHGRFRNKVLSDTIISSYNEFPKELPIDKNELIEEASKNLENSARFLKTASRSMTDTFLKMLEQEDRLYVRQGFGNTLEINYPLIDSIMIRHNDQASLYASIDQLEEFLGTELGHYVRRQDLLFGTKTKLKRTKISKNQDAFNRAISLLKEYQMNSLNDPEAFGLINHNEFQKLISRETGLTRNFLELYRFKKDLEWFESCRGDITILERDLSRQTILAIPEYAKIVKEQLPMGSRLRMPQVLERLKAINSRLRIPNMKLSLLTCRRNLNLFCQFKSVSIGQKRERGVEITGY